MKVKIKTPGIIPSQDVEIDIRDSSVLCVDGDCTPLVPILAKGWAEAILSSPLVSNEIKNKIREDVPKMLMEFWATQKPSLEDLAIFVGNKSPEKIIKNVEFLHCPSVTPFPIVLTSDDPEDCLP